MKRIENKQQHKQDAYHIFLEKQIVKDEMLTVYQQDFQPLKEFLQNIDYRYLEEISINYKQTLEQFLQTQDILKKIKVGLKAGEVSLKLNIRLALIKLLYLRQPVPAIFIFLKISQNLIEINYKEDLSLILNTILSKRTIDTSKNDYLEMHDELMDQSDQSLILQTISLVNKQFDSSALLNQRQFEIFDQVYNQFNKIDFSCSPEIIIKIVAQMKEFHEKLEKNRQDLESVKSEKFPQFVLKIILMLLRQREIVIPEILNYIYFKALKNDGNKICLAIRATAKELQVLFQHPKIKPCLDLLMIDVTLFSKGISGYEQMFKKCQTDYPHFLKLKLNGALIHYLEYLEQMSMSYKEQFYIIYENSEFSHLLTSIWNICGKEIQQILQNMVNEEIEFLKFGSNILRIGTILYRIKFKLDKKIKMTNHPASTLERIFITQEQSQDKRNQCVTERNMNPLFKTFVTKLVQKKKPFPFLLKTLKMDLYHLKVGYRTTEMRELVNDPKFKKFMKKAHGVTWDNDDPDENLSYIISRSYPQPVGQNGKKYELNWPRLIKKEAKLILDNKENFTQQLLEVRANQNFKKVYGELIKLDDNNKKKMQTKEILMKLVDYINSIKH